MSVLTREAVVSLNCLDLVAEQLRLPLPATLAGEPMWRGDGERAGRADRVRAELASAGLWRHGSPSDEFTDAVRLLCRAGSEFFAHVGTVEQDYRLHVAVSGRDAVLACHVPRNGQVLLRPARAEAPVEDLVTELPEVRPGAGPALSVPEADLRAAMAGKPAQRDVRRLLELCALPRHSGGQLSAGTRDALGTHRTSGGDSCTVVGTERGSWLFSFSGSPAAGRHVNVAPARFDIVVGKVYELGQQLRGPAKR